MALKSDISVASSKFDPKNIPSSVDAFYSDLFSKGPGGGFGKIFEVGLEKSRALELKGEGGFRKFVKLPSSTDIEIPSREDGRSIPCRVVAPEAGKTPRGVFMHIHGGGYVCGSHLINDEILKQFTDAADLVTVSIGYRLAPEFKWPLPLDDCVDAMEWLIDNAEEKFGAPLAFIGGDSAGGYFSIQCGIRLASHQNPRYSKFPLKGLVLYYGSFGVTHLPSTYINNTKEMLSLCQSVIKSFLPDTKMEKDPLVSPLYFNFNTLPADAKLPPALFICGTRDFFVDDSMLMCTRWLTAGGEAALHLIPGAYHGFYELPLDAYEGLQEARDIVDEFMRARLG